MLQKRFFRMVLMGIKKLQDPYYQGFAAQLSFYYLLSIVPCVLLITQLLGAFNVTLTPVIDIIKVYTDGVLSKTFINLLTYNSAGAVNIVFICIVLWAASRAQFSMVRITNYTFSDGTSTGRGYFRERFRAILTMVVTLFTVAFALVIVVYGENILEMVMTVFPISLKSEELWLYMRWPVAFLLFLFMMAYHYYVLPSVRIPFKKVLPGTFLASVGILIVTFIYSKYAAFQIGDYDIIYGSLASIVALLIWFYLLAWVICLGVLFNKVWWDTEGAKSTESDIK